MVGIQWVVDLYHIRDDLPTKLLKHDFGANAGKFLVPIHLRLKKWKQSSVIKQLWETLFLAMKMRTAFTKMIYVWTHFVYWALFPLFCAFWLGSDIHFWDSPQLVCWRLEGLHFCEVHHSVVKLRLRVLTGRNASATALSGWLVTLHTLCSYISHLWWSQYTSLWRGTEFPKAI